MTTALDKIKALAQAVKDTGPDLTQAQSGGGDYTPPAEGATRLRFVGYYEKGVHTTVYNGAPKTKPRAIFVFELSGPKHPPREHEGKLYPQTIRFTEVVGRHEKNGYMKLFSAMSKDYPGTTNFIELLGQSFRGTVVHKKSKDGKKTFANLKNSSGYTITGTQYEDPESGELRQVKVDEPISPLQVFLWDYTDLEQWDSIFVDGTYDDGSSKNKLQEEIKAAENFVGSPIYNLLMENGREAETVPAPKVAKSDEGEEDDGAGEDKKVETKAASVKSELAKDEADPLAGV